VSFVWQDNCGIIKVSQI